MVRKPGSHYEAGRSLTLLKIKTFLDAEARVVGHQAGAGRHKGRLGALLAELPDGTRFSVGTGLSDAEREAPPALGSIITFRYQELSDGGVPRFPSYVGVRPDATWSAPASTLEPPSNLPATTLGARRFELVEGSSQKFWEIRREAFDVTVRYGRIGTDGQSKTKGFADEEGARKYFDGLIREKEGKGYEEVAE